MVFTNMQICFVEDIQFMPSRIYQGRFSGLTMECGDVYRHFQLLVVLWDLLLEVRLGRKLKDFGEMTLMLCAWTNRAQDGKMDVGS